MATHVVCLDGTDQTKTQDHPTNIARLFDALGGTAVDAGGGSWEAAGAPAQGKYLPGVGAEGHAVLRLLGNAFGAGIAEPIVRGYTFLSRRYALGDEIIITGFSRGATAARALAGLIAARGLLNPARYDPADKDEAYLRAVAAWYDYRSYWPHLVEQARLAWMALRLGRPFSSLTAADYVTVPGILAVGVFDTVSSLGLPSFSQNDVRYDFAIIDTRLSDKVRHGFHALAADETRDLFAPTFWTERAGIVQQIFPGAHSNVGGGYPQRGLSDGALAWMLDQLEAIGLPLDRARVDPPIAPDPLDIAHDDARTLLFVGTPCRPRIFPASAMANAAVGARWGRPTEIFPGGVFTPYRAVGTFADGVAIHQDGEVVS